MLKFDQNIISGIQNLTLHDLGKIHVQRFGKKYHLSWLEHGLDRKFEWEEARNYCRKFCMDSVTFDSPREYRYFKNLIKKGKNCMKIILNLISIIIYINIVI